MVTFTGYRSSSFRKDQVNGMNRNERLPLTRVVHRLLGNDLTSSYTNSRNPDLNLMDPNFGVKVMDDRHAFTKPRSMNRRDEESED